MQAKPEGDMQSLPLVGAAPGVPVPGSVEPADAAIAVHEGPFGLKMGLPIKDLGGTEIPGAPGKYLLANVPVPHHAFENYIAEASPTAGLCWIKGIGKPIETNRFGMSLRTQYEQLRDKLAKVYGTKFKETDALSHGSIWKDPGEWMMALTTKDRVLQAVWESSAGLGLPYDLSSVGISVSATSHSTGRIVVHYQFKNEPQCDAEISVKADVGLGSSEAERKAAQERGTTETEGADALADESAEREAFRFGAMIGERVAQHWLSPSDDLRGLECTLELRLEPTGHVGPNVRVVSSSGSDAFDRSAVTAVLNASPMPVPTGPAFELLRHFRFKFRP
jgi:TonB family protein